MKSSDQSGQNWGNTALAISPIVEIKIYMGYKAVKAAFTS
jgi:hypothetical protein